jgi:uncharacterized protein
MGNPVMHFEVGGPDDGPLIAFYSELFGWEVQSVPDYTLVDTRGGTGINGGIGKSRTGDPWSAFYVEVGDMQATLDKAASLGGETVVPVTELPGVTYAMFSDPDGLLVGIVKSDPAAEEQQQGPSPGTGAPVDWFEVLGSDAERTKTFYKEMFGWTIAEGQGAYGLVDTGAGRGIQGGIGAAGDTRWATIYASVPDVEEALARAEKLGGSRVYGPMAVDDHMETGAFRDPAGNSFGVYHHGTH